MHYFELQELGCVLLGIDPYDDFDEHKLENDFYQKFGIELLEAEELIKGLMQLTIPAQSAVTEQWFKGFVKDGAFIVKTEVKG